MTIRAISATALAMTLALGSATAEATEHRAEGAAETSTGYALQIVRSILTMDNRAKRLEQPPALGLYAADGTAIVGVPPLPVKSVSEEGLRLTLYRKGDRLIRLGTSNERYYEKVLYDQRLLFTELRSVRCSALKQWREPRHTVKSGTHRVRLRFHHTEQSSSGNPVSTVTTLDVGVPQEQVVRFAVALAQLAPEVHVFGCGGG
jgi:hypothetical protein